MSDGDALTGLYLDTQNQPVVDECRPELPVFTEAFKWLDDYFAGRKTPVSFTLSPAGTAFQKQVWEILLTIPFGQTRSYGQIARQISLSMSPQAVGGAVGRNPISIITFPATAVSGQTGSLQAMTEGCTISVGCCATRRNTNDRQ